MNYDVAAGKKKPRREPGLRCSKLAAKKIPRERNPRKKVPLPERLNIMADSRWMTAITEFIFQTYLKTEPYHSREKLEEMLAIETAVRLASPESPSLYEKIAAEFGTVEVLEHVNKDASEDFKKLPRKLQDILNERPAGYYSVSDLATLFSAKKRGAKPTSETQERIRIMANLLNQGTTLKAIGSKLFSESLDPYQDARSFKSKHRKEIERHRLPSQ